MLSDQGVDDDSDVVVLSRPSFGVSRREQVSRWSQLGPPLNSDHLWQERGTSCPPRTVNK
jgi:hypothetical protein